MEKEMVGGVPSDVLGTLEDILCKIRKGSISPEELKRFAKRENPFIAGTILEELVSKTQKLLSKRFNKKIEVDPLPSEFTEENLHLWAKYNLKPVFLPDEEIGENRPLKNWVKPEKWFYQKIKEGKIAKDSARIKPGWYLADFTPSVDYNDGIQVYPNDPFALIIERLRSEGKVGKYDKTPPGSRFAIVPQDEWPIVLAEIAKELGFKTEQVGLERVIEFNTIGNLYDSNRGKFNIWEWFADSFEDSSRLDGGYRDSGGLANVSYDGCRWSDDRYGSVAGRPLVSFKK